jgi:hypothetical protein
MNDYQKEQLSAFELVRSRLPELRTELRKNLSASLSDYFSFRKQTDLLLEKYFSNICKSSCYQNQRSACCTKDGIITFFADVVINGLHGENSSLDLMEYRLRQPHSGPKCLYLADEGCLWSMKPINCHMFLCDSACKEVFTQYPETETTWNKLLDRKKRFTWPDRTVLFDEIESVFLSAGITSPLMYLHNSPGLLRVKQKAGLPV